MFRKDMKRVYVDMVGDLFHRGHVEFLRKAKQFEEKIYLIVGIHSDEDCTSYKRKPIFSMKDRVEIVKACKYVDEVIPNAPIKISEEFLDRYKIDIVIHGSDMNKYLKEVCYQIPIERKIMRIIPYYRLISTTKIIKKIKNANKKSL